MSLTPSARRLMKEAAELSMSPSPHFHATPIADNLFDWHFTLSGPPSPSPYANGLYHGRIILPSTYPLRPPSFRFLTPSGRFEVNREICLSISGHHEENWQPAWGIRTALIAIRSFMEGDAKGQLGGLDVDDKVRRVWAVESRGWRCDVCQNGNGQGGRTNEEVMNEWREFCRLKGTLDDDDDEVDSSGGGGGGGGGDKKKEESSRSEVTDDTATTGKEKKADASLSHGHGHGHDHGYDHGYDYESLDNKEATTNTTTTTTSSSASTPLSTAETDKNPITNNSNILKTSSPNNNDTQINPSTSGSSFHHPQQQESINHQPSQTTTLPSLATRQIQQRQQQHRERISRTTATVTRERAISTATRTTTSSSSREDLWLDRTIIGVIIALIFIILRRILNSYNDDYL